MRPETWLEEALGSRARVRVLRLLTADPRRVRTEREIAAAVGMSPSSVHAALKGLRDAGLLDSQRIGRSHAIRLRGGLAVAVALQRLFQEERATLYRLEAAVRRSLPRGVACYLFGSTARGTAGRESDVDVLVVARTTAEADEASARAVRAIGRVVPARVSVLALDGAGLRRRRGSPLLRRVLEEGRPLTSTRLEAFL